MEDTNVPILRYTFAAIFIIACLHDLQLGLKVAGVYIAGISLWGLFVGKVPVVDAFENTADYLTGASAMAASAIGIFIGMIFFFAPGWVIANLAH
jgi:hypothetical protein